MNEKILKLVDAIYENESCKDADEFSLTINLKREIESRTFPEVIKPVLDAEWKNKITEIINKEPVVSFNLSLKFNSGINKDISAYKTKWYSCQIIFHGQTEIEVAFDMLSSYSHLSDGEFNRIVKDKYVTDYPNTIQKMVELKDILIKNIYSVVDKLLEIKKS